MDPTVNRRFSKKMLGKSLALAAGCTLLSAGGYAVSSWRAGVPVSVDTALAAAGGPGLLSSSEHEGSGYRISSLTVFSEVALKLRDNYVDPARIDPKEMLVEALQRVEREVAEVMVTRKDANTLQVRAMDDSVDIFIGDVSSVWQVSLKLREAFRFLEATLPTRDDYRDIEYAAINGALSTLDPHSVLLEPEAFAEMKTSTRGEFGGLGIVISVRDGKLTIISPLDDTPASRAGLRAGDIISRIGQVSTISMPIEEAVQMLRGPEGSKVDIWVEREDWPSAKKFSVTRERIKIQSVEGELLSANIGYIKIKNFQQNTDKDLGALLNKLDKEADGQLAGLLLDLRNNPGGLLEQAIRVSDRFLTSGEIVTTVGYGNQMREPKKARWSGTRAKVPLAVLVNKGSASASEIVAGALKNQDRAVVIGERTFGKGSVQVLYDFADDSALKLTIAQYLTPGGVSIQSEGVVPDIKLQPAVITDDAVRVFYEAEGYREVNLDKHLDRAGVPAFETKASHALKFLVDDLDPKPDASDGVARFSTDAVVRFGHAFLLEAGTKTRRSSLKSGERFLSERERAEQDRIASALSAKGVDWSKGPSLAPNLDIELSIDGKVLEAGQDVELTATVENEGDNPVHRLRGVLVSNHPAFVGRELMFGRIAPGEKRSWTVKTHVPESTPPRTDLVELGLAVDEGPLEAKAEVAVITHAAPFPRFGYAYEIDDAKRGDGDGVLESGEGAALVVLLKNEGEGPADEVSVRLKSGARENLFLETGSAQIDGLAPGETKVARLEFRVPEEVSSRTLPLQLTVYDTRTGEWLEDEITLTAAPPDDRVATEATEAAALRAGTVLSAAPAEGASVLARTAEGGDVDIVASVGSWAKVAMGDAFGFVPRSEVVSAPAGAKAKLEYISSRQGPNIVLDAELWDAPHDSPRVTLRGKVHGKRIRDLYVVLNDEKVFFKTGPDSGDADASVDLEVPIELNDGVNEITVVARHDDTLMSFRNVLVSRRAQGGPPVAEAPSVE